MTNYLFYTILVLLVFFSAQVVQKWVLPQWQFASCHKIIADLIFN